MKQLSDPDVALGQSNQGHREAGCWKAVEGTPHLYLCIEPGLILVIPLQLCQAWP